MPLMFDERYEEEEPEKKPRIKRKPPEPLEGPRRYIVRVADGVVRIDKSPPTLKIEYRLMGTHETLEGARRRLGW